MEQQRHPFGKERKEVCASFSCSAENDIAVARTTLSLAVRFLSRCSSWWLTLDISAVSEVVHADSDLVSMVGCEDVPRSIQRILNNERRGTDSSSYWSKVVFPEPRNPVSRVTGIFLSASSDIVCDSGCKLADRADIFAGSFSSQLSETNHQPRPYPDRSLEGFKREQKRRLSKVSVIFSAG